MPHQFSEAAPGGAVSGRKTVRRQSRGFVIEYDVASTAEEPVVVHLADRVPVGRTEEFGFHREHEPAAWTVSDGALGMRLPLDPGEERTVVLGVVPDGDLEDAAAEPSVGVQPARAPPDDGDGNSSPAAGDDAAPGEGDAEPDFEQGPTVDADAATEDRNRPDTAHVDEAPRDTHQRDDEHRDTDDVVSSLVEQLEAGTVSESELDTLREHLGPRRPASENARLEYVQKRLGDFDAYVDALEDLLSVHGGGEDVVSELEGRLDDLADDVESVRRRQDELADRLDDLAADQSAHSETVEALQDAHEADVAAVRSDVGALEAAVDDFESRRRAPVEDPEQSAGPGDASSGNGDGARGRGAVTEDGPTPGRDDPGAERGVGQAGSPDEAIEIQPGRTDAPAAGNRGDDATGDRFVVPGGNGGPNGDDGADRADPPGGGDERADGGPDDATDEGAVADAEARAGIDAAVVPFEGEDAPGDGGAHTGEPADDGGDDDGSGGAGGADDPTTDEPTGDGGDDARADDATTDGPSGDDDESGGWTSSIF